LRQAGALAYTTLLAIVPILTVGFFALSLFPIFHNVKQRIETVIFENFIAEAAQNVQQYLTTFIGQTQHLPILGIVTLLATAILLVTSMEKTFNDIWQLTKPRHSIIAFFIYMAGLVLLPIFIAITLTLSAYLSTFPIIETSLIKKIVFLCIPYLATFVAFALLYTSLPNCKVPFKAAAVGSFVATILFELAKKGFVIYINIFANYKLIYGALSLIPIFLVWLYIFWVILLFGVVVSYVITKNTKK
jgi:membrane protein